MCFQAAHSLLPKSMPRSGWKVRLLNLEISAGLEQTYTNVLWQPRDKLHYKPLKRFTKYVKGVSRRFKSSSVSKTKLLRALRRLSNKSRWVRLEDCDTSTLV
jgi:hypothetical protein